MSILINLATVLVGIILIGLVFYLMVNKKMTESQSVLWILIGIATIILGIFPGIINIVAKRFGIWYAPSISFLIAYIGLLFIVFKNTVLISIHSNQINELFMEVTLLNHENEKLKKELTAIRRGEDSY